MMTAPPTAAPPVPILVVDDNVAKRLALRAVLAPLGYRIVEADSGIAALRCVMAEDFAVILLDAMMPTMDGFETAALIRQRSQSEMTPIIFITAYKSHEIEKADLYAEGAFDFIFAPLRPNELRAKVSVFANLFQRAQALATRARQVQASADQVLLLTETAPIGIFQTDAHSNYVYTNPGWSEITGMQASAAKGNKWDVIIRPDLRAAVRDELSAAVENRRDLGHRFEIFHPASGARIVLITSKSIPGRDGQIAGWVGTLADVTAEVGAEAALSGARDAATEASRLKSEFLANMSHEIRTPMNGVIGMTDLLLETDLDPRQRDYAQTVRNSGEALLTIINDILDFSKVEAGKLQIEEIEFGLRSIIDDVVDLLSGSAQVKGLELVAVVDRALPSVVAGDPGRLRQVLTNLIGNAIKFTQTGQIVVRVKKIEELGRDSMIRFEVSDSGVGIATDKLELIFQPFVQADMSTSRMYGGTGLGLAISAELVSLMGGTRGVSSELGVGSTFWFTIAVRTEGGPLTRTLPAQDPALLGVRVLIVDDNPGQRRTLCHQLTEMGMVAVSADSGPSALAEMRTAVAEDRPFAVAIIDRTMPGMDGLQLKNAILDEPALRARLVLLTGLNHEQPLGDAAHAGLCASLTKPVRRDDLRSVLRVALEPLAATEAIVAAAAPTLSIPRSAAGRVLLAEDNLINQKVAVAILSNAGYRVDTVCDGAAAVRAAATNTYDAILMDCHMPELNGYEATAAIRAQEGPTRRTPIIAMTAGARWEDRTRCLAEGMDSYLGKPISKDALLALVARSVTNGRSPRETSARILLAEDDPVNQHVAAAMLENLGFVVDIVADGPSAVAAAAETDYRTILMDCYLPLLDGYEATAEIRGREGATRHTPIIAVTASAMESDHQRCLAAGMDDFLTKPLALKALAAALAIWTPGAAADGADGDDDLPPVAPVSRQVLAEPDLAEPDGASDGDRPVRSTLARQVVERLEQLGRIAGDDLLGKLSAMFRTEAVSRVTALRDAFSSRNAEALFQSAHALSGSSATLGASDLAQLCSTLAIDGEAGVLIRGESQLEAVEAELTRVVRVLLEDYSNEMSGNGFSGNALKKAFHGADDQLWHQRRL